jgi:hypothetical protein
MNLTRAEHGVIIRFDAEEQIAHIYSAWPRWITKLDKLATENEGRVLVRRTDTDVECQCPRGFISLRKPPTHNRKTRAEMAERMKALRSGPVGRNSKLRSAKGGI